MTNPGTPTVQSARPSVQTADGPMVVSLAQPAGTPRAAVVVVQEAFGVTGYVEDVTRRLAAHGYLAAAPHLFHRSGDAVLGYGDLDAVRPHRSALTADGLAADVDATLALLAESGLADDRLAVVGFCMGGSVALATAARRRLGAAVTFYGGGVGAGRFGYPPLVELAPGLRTPWLGLYGDRDTGIPVTDVEALRAAAATSDVATEVVRYPQAQHGFHCNGRPAVFDPAAGADAWARTLAWFDAHLAP